MTVEDGDAEVSRPRFGRRPTMGAIAAHLGVSRQLVSIVLRDQRGASSQTREVRRAADELAYSPDVATQMLRRKGSRYLGVLLTLDEGSSVEVVENMHHSAAQRGYKLVLAARSAFHNEDAAVEELLGCRSMPDATLRRRGYLAAAKLWKIEPDVVEVRTGYMEEAGSTGAGVLLERSTLPQRW